MPSGTRPSGPTMMLAMVVAPRAFSMSAMAWSSLRWRGQRLSRCSGKAREQAFFGVYGMLGIGLMLFSLRAMKTEVVWKTKVLRFSFWSLNIGLALMALISMLPVGILQTVAAVQHGLWYARSAEFMQQELIQNLSWLRVIGDIIFSLGIVGIGVFIVGLTTGGSVEGTRQDG